MIFPYYCPCNSAKKIKTNVMTPTQHDELGMTDPPEGKPPAEPGEALPHEEVDPTMIGPAIKINPVDDNDPKPA
jgi:hypothetical protein